MNKKIYYINWVEMQKDFSDTVFSYDALRFISCLQGVVNREGPKLYLDFITENNADKFWFSYMTEPGKLLFGYEKIEISSFFAFIETFSDTIKSCGISLWDSNVPSTMNVACTACGVLGYLPVRGNVNLKLYEALKKTGVMVTLNMVNKFDGKGIIWGTDRESTGSKKNDAYIFAIENYMDKTCDSILGFIVDGISWNKDNLNYPDLNNAQTTNVDYLVSKKAFIWDLFPYENLLPGDDLSQKPGTDRSALIEILQKQYNKSNGEKFTAIVGFQPWMCKYAEKGASVWYVEGIENGVALEWFYAKLFAEYNMFMDGDAPGYSGIANCSVYMHYPLKDKYKNNYPKNVAPYDKSKKYIYFYMGDYDSSAWTYRFIPAFFNDKNRGTLPLGWAFNLNLSDRIPMAFDYVMENKTDNDYFICGDSGAGYLQPEFLKNISLEGWIKHNKYYYEKFDVSMTGFLLNPDSPLTERVLSAYNTFSPTGSLYYCGEGKINGSKDYFWKPYIYNSVPYMRVAGDVAIIGGTVESTVLKVKELIAQSACVRDREKENHSNFYIFRTILISPSFIKKVQEELLKEDLDCVFPDPYTLCRLMLEGNVVADVPKK